MNRLEEAYRQGVKEKFGVDKLQTEPATRTVELVDPPKTTPQTHYGEFMQGVKDKFHMDGLQLEGALGRRLQSTLADASIEDARSRSKGMKVATAKVNYQGKTLKLWYEITRF